VILTVLIVNAIYFTISTSIFRFLKEKIMARPVYITQKLVFDAAERLLNNGIPFIEINNPKIRKELGKGSPNDIQPLLQEWRKQHVIAKGENVDIPDQFKEELAQFGSSLWKLASQITAEKYSHQYEDYHSIQTELAETNLLFENVENELETFRNSLNGICDELSNLKESVATSKGKLLHSNSDDYAKKAEDEMNVIRNKIEEIINTYADRRITPKTSPSEVS
jgi:septation ring formation regulator EzrA